MNTIQEKNSSYRLLTEAYSEYRRRLTSYAFLKVHNRELSDDLVQETFMKTWKYLLKGGEIKAMKAFLYHILNNLIVDEYRKRKTISLDQLFEKGYEPRVEPGELAPDTLDGEVVLRLLKKLPLPYRIVLTMRYIQGLSLHEMSLITGKSKNTMAVQAHRGLEKLKRLYQQI